MKGTFEEIINFYAANDLEFDANIGDEDMGATFSFCGLPHFSKYCYEKYGDLLNAQAEIQSYESYTDVVIVDYPDAKKGNAFTMAWAGYVGESEYDKLFEEE